MANDKSSTQATKSATPAIDVRPLHLPFSWLPGQLETSASAQFAARTMDVAAGTKVIAQVLRRHVQDLCNLADATPGVVPLMSSTDIDALAGLAAASLDDLYNAAASQIAAIEHKALKGERA